MVHKILIPKVIFISLIFLMKVFIPLSVSAQKVMVISENGNHVDIPVQIQNKIAHTTASSESILRTWFVSQGYLDAKLGEVAEGNFEVVRGCRYEVSKFEFLSDRESETTLFDLGGYSEGLIGRVIKKRLYELEEQGYLFAKAEIQSLNPNRAFCKVELTVQIEKGTEQRSNGILFPGASSNSPEYLQRITGYQDSLLITSRLTEKLRVKLIESEFFEEVAEPEIFIQGQNPVIVIAVQERALNQFDGLLGYVPNQNGNSHVVGDFELSLWNVLNQGNGIDLMYQRLRPETSRLHFGISQNYLGSIPAGIEGTFDFYQNDTTYQARSIGLNSYYSISRGLKITGGIQNTVSVSSNTAQLILEPDGKKRSAELGFKYSTILNVDNPTQGIVFNVSLGVSNKSVDIDSIRAFTQRFIHAEWSYYVPVSSKSVLAFSTQGYFLGADKITENDLIRFGGANSLRGYSEEQFQASRLLWGDIEYRFLVNRLSYLFGFGAVGGYHRSKLLTETDNTFKVSEVLFSTGFGISYKTRIGRLKFAYALSPQESLGNGKVHVGVVTRL